MTKYTCTLTEDEFNDNCANKALLEFYTGIVERMGYKQKNLYRRVLKTAYDVQYNSRVSFPTRNLLIDAIHSFVSELSCFQNETFDFKSEMDSDGETRVEWGNPMKVGKLKLEVYEYGLHPYDVEVTGQLKELIVYSDDDVTEKVHIKNLNECLQYGDYSNDDGLAEIQKRFSKFFESYFNYRKELNKIKELGLKFKPNTI